MEENRNLENVVNVRAILDLQHTDVPQSEHREERVDYIIETYDDGSSTMELNTFSGNYFSNMSGLICIKILLDKIFGSKKKKKKSSENNPKNILDLSASGYFAIWNFYFEGQGNYAAQTIRMIFEGEVDGINRYVATIETIHHYPKALSSDITKMLPNDIFLLNSQQQNKLYGSTVLHWQKNNGDIFSVPADIEIILDSGSTQLNNPQIFSCEYIHDTTDTLPLEVQVQSTVYNVKE